MKLDRIHIENLVVFAHHGVLESENELGQKFLVTLDLFADLRAAGREDDLGKTLNYAEICHFVKGIMEDRNYNLIEAVAEKIAHELLLKYDGLVSVDVEIKKPWAPIMLPLDAVSVRISRSWHTAYLSIGSNLGDKESYLDFAIDRLNKDKETKVTKISEYIETEPYGGIDQDNFLNGALEIRTLKSPEELLLFIHEIEKDGNRERLIHWGPRTIDIDIIFYDQEIIESEDLTIPHWDMANRMFVLEPMMNIAPFVYHPVLKKSIRQLWNELKETEDE